MSGLARVLLSVNTGVSAEILSGHKPLTPVAYVRATACIGVNLWRQVCRSHRTSELSFDRLLSSPRGRSFVDSEQIVPAVIGSTERSGQPLKCRSGTPYVVPPVTLSWSQIPCYRDCFTRPECAGRTHLSGRQGFYPQSSPIGIVWPSFKVPAGHTLVVGVLIVPQSSATGMV